MNIIQKLEKEQLDSLVAKRPVPNFGAGDTLKVNVKVIEGDRTRVQAYEGVCIARFGAGINESFTVRKISYGEGVERIFPVYSPFIESIEIVRRGRVGASSDNEGKGRLRHNTDDTDEIHEPTPTSSY